MARPRKPTSVFETPTEQTFQTLKWAFRNFQKAGIDSQIPWERGQRAIAPLK